MKDVLPSDSGRSSRLHKVAADPSGALASGQGRASFGVSRGWAFLYRDAMRHQNMIVKSLLAMLGGALFLLAPASAAPPPPAKTIEAHPALWVVKDTDTTIYLFGTVHLLDPKYRWFSDGVKDAFESASELVVETVPPPPAEAQALVAKLAVDPQGRTLTSRLPPKLAARYGRELGALSLPANALDTYEPWFAGVTLSVLEYGRMGMNPESGVDVSLMAFAKAAGKPIVPLEGFGEQLAYFSDLSDAQQLQFLDLSVKEMKDAPTMIGKLATAWANGDPATLARLMNEGTRQMPELSKRLLDDRNARFADWIKARLARPGIVFVAIGAGHLGGKASVQAMLAARGVASERVR